MNFHVYGYGAMLLACAGLYAWLTIVNHTVATRDAQIERYQADVVQAQSRLDQAKTTNTENDIAIKNLQADQMRQAESAIRFELLARARGAKLKAILKGISDAPSSDDGPVAPVLRRELDRLRDVFNTSAPNGTDPGEDRAPAVASQ